MLFLTIWSLAMHSYMVPSAEKLPITQPSLFDEFPEAVYLRYLISLIVLSPVYKEVKLQCPVFIKVIWTASYFCSLCCYNLPEHQFPAAVPVLWGTAWTGQPAVTYVDRLACAVSSIWRIQKWVSRKHCAFFLTGLKSCWVWLSLD